MEFTFLIECLMDFMPIYLCGHRGSRRKYISKVKPDLGGGIQLAHELDLFLRIAKGTRLAHANLNCDSMTYAHVQRRCTCKIVGEQCRKKIFLLKK